MTLPKEQVERFSRQLLLPEIATAGQAALLSTGVLVVGLGGRIGALDYDVVEVSNLQRQVIHSESSVGVSKALSAKEAIHRFATRLLSWSFSKIFRLNSTCECVVHDTVLDSSNALAVLNK
ncbi:hypothetical protein HK101_007291 [Irineochytrium annulatum]|nr:hypothetical protein HK101_007291 [Irineochytrium annulatum]